MVDVVHARATDAAVVEDEAARLDDVHRYAERGGEPHHRAGVLGNVGFEEDEAHDRSLDGEKRVTRETELYAPVKSFLTRRGFTVKAEVGACDVFAVRGDEPPVIVELKRRFTLELLLQGVDRLSLSDAVYLATERPGRNARGPTLLSGDVRKLCRRLGLGLLSVEPKSGLVEVVLDPVPYTPRRDKKRVGRLLGEFERRAGDPNVGGSTRTPIVTAYRQDALRCARLLLDGPRKLGDLRKAGAPADAARILQRDVYGWFERVERGVYALRDAGRAALDRFARASEDGA